MIAELHENILPYVGKYTSLKKVTPHEYAGPCPVCGGTDRFHLHDQKGWFCRKCTGEKWGDLADFTKLAFGWTLRETLKQFHLDRKATPEELARMDAERKARDEQARQEEHAEQAKVHDQLTQEAAWYAYHQNLDRCNTRQLWNERGLSDGWVNYYKLGYNPGRSFGQDDSRINCASLTIPYFRATHGNEETYYQVIGLQHRLLADNPPGGKYRPHMAGAGKHLFFTDIDQKNVFGDLLIVEGEIKAMVTWASLWAGTEPLAPNMTVIGIPGQGWREEWAAQFNLAERVFICLDPDAQKSAGRLLGMIDRPAKNIMLPDKIDDLINIGVLDGMKLLEVCYG